MSVSSANSLNQFKSPLRSLSRAFFSSRQLWKARAKRLQAELQRTRTRLQCVQRDQARLQNLNQKLSRQLELQTTQAANPLPTWKNLAGHQYSAEMICLCCQLSLLIGFRAVPKVIETFANMFDLQIEVPSRDAVRNWCCRNGVAILQEASYAEDWVWMIDHSVQLGKMFVLAVLGIRQSELPSDRALRREDMTPLAVLPSTSRDKVEVAKQLGEVAEQFGAPLAVLSDGARELHEGVRLVKNDDFSPVHLDDLKHKIANHLKKLLRGNERWKAFSAKLGTTTAAIQQTELEHLLPPRKKEKCRFMDFGRLIDWAKMVEHQLAQTTSPNHDRVVEKLGWIEEFRGELQLWNQYRRLVSESLEIANEKGVFTGASERLRKCLMDCQVEDELAYEFADQIVSFYQHNEAQLGKSNLSGLRLPCSTEVLESAFGNFKALQGHHGRGTFTTLLAAFATQFDHCTAAKIRERFSRVSNEDVKVWIKSSGLTNSTQSRRTSAYRMARASETLFSAA